MKRRTIVALAFVALLSAQRLLAQQAAPGVAGGASDPRLASAMPGPEHEELAEYAGAWTVVIKMGGGPRSLVYNGTAESEMVVGGRFLQIAFRAEGETGPNEGLFTIGFDKRHKRYALIAMDNFGTYFVTSQGERTGELGPIRMAGVDDDPMMKSLGYTKEFLHVIELRSADEFSIEVRLIDTRTTERREMPYITYAFARKN